MLKSLHSNNGIRSETNADAKTRGKGMTGLWKAPTLQVNELPKMAVRKHVLWLPVDSQGPTNNVSLSAELEYFAEYVKLDEMEVNSRRSLLIDLYETLLVNFPSAQVNQYGSFPAGLSTFISDVDVSVDNMFNSYEDGATFDANEPLHSNQNMKRPASPEQPSSFTPLKRARTDESTSTEQSDVSALRQRVAEKLALKKSSSEVTVEEDVPVSWTIETTTSAFEPTADTIEPTNNDAKENLTESSENGHGASESDFSVYHYNSSSSEICLCRKEKLRALQKLHKALKPSPWIEQIQFRKHARVPILNLTHKNGVECDVSLDMSQQATSLVVRALLQRCGLALAKLSAFLKIYLNQLGLDAPFTGGLGSFKLYVLLAEHIDRQPQDIELGPLLMGFLKFYGDSHNLDYFTVIAVDGAEELHFRHVSKLTEICEAFAKAHAVLLKLQLQRKFLKRNDGKEENTASDLGNQPSSSLLAALLNTEMLSVQRMQRRARCHRSPQRDTSEYSWGNSDFMVEEDDFVVDEEGENGGEDGEIGWDDFEGIDKYDCDEGDDDGFDEANGTSDDEGDLDANDDSEREEEEESESEGEGEGEGACHDGKVDAFERLQNGVVIVQEGKTQEPDSIDRDADLASVTSKDRAENEANAFLNEILNPPSTTSLYHQFRADIPLLAMQECMSTKTKKRTFRAGSIEGKAIISGTMELPRGMCVQHNYMHMLPRKYVIALGPFRMLCVAECYLRKSYAELMEQEDRQKAAIQRIRNLLKAKYFDTCSAEDKTFLRQIYMTGLIIPPQEIEKQFTKFEKKLRNESKCCTRAVKLFLTQRAVAVGAPHAVLHDLHPTVNTLHLEALQAQAAAAREFNPRNDIGKAIVAGLLDLPPKMLVAKKDVTKLPQHYQKPLRLFRSLEESEHYKNMSFEELTLQRAAAQARKDHLQWHYNAHGWMLLGTTNPKKDKKTLQGLVAEGTVDPPKEYVMPNSVKKQRKAALECQKDWNAYYLLRVKAESQRRQALQKQQDGLQHSVTPLPRMLHLPATSILHSIERAIPVLVIQDYTSSDDIRLFSPTTDMGHAILRGELPMPQGMTVLPDQVKALPEILATALGPFRMLCLAHMYVGKAYAELVQQEEAQEAAVRQLKELYETGHFTCCPQEELLLLRRVFVAGLLRFENSTQVVFTKMEKMLNTRTAAHLRIVSKYLADRAWCMGLTPRIPALPVVLRSASHPIVWPQLDDLSVSS